VAWSVVWLEFTTPTGRVTSESATVYSLAIAFDLLEPHQRQHADDRLAEIVTKSNFTISTGFARTPLVTDALSSTGHVEEAYLLLLQERCPSFLYPVTKGATTIWERWDSVRPDGSINPSGMTSLNHYALGAVASWMHRVIGCLTATAPGYETMRIAPQPGGGLTHATLEHDTVHGRVTVAWSLDGQRGHMSVTVTAGTQAELVLPAAADTAALRLSAGTHEFDYDLEVAPLASVTLDTPLSELASHPRAWAAVSGLFAVHMPSVPLDASAPESAQLSLAQLLQYLPGEVHTLREELSPALERLAN